MHENRETSEAPAAKPGGRAAGEGKSHTARVYVCEESHSGVVPMNHSNKDKRSSAESGEGRPLIKENASQPNTHPTQSGVRGRSMSPARKIDSPIFMAGFIVERIERGLREECT